MKGVIVLSAVGLALGLCVTPAQAEVVEVNGCTSVYFNKWGVEARCKPNPKITKFTAVAHCKRGAVTEGRGGIPVPPGLISRAFCRSGWQRVGKGVHTQGPL